MKCPQCGIEMSRKKIDTWVCRNKRCQEFAQEKRITRERAPKE